MAEAVANKRDARLDLRMPQKLKSQIEEAAAINGTTVSQWSIDRLAAASRNDIESSRRIALDDEAFEDFCAILDEPNPTFEGFAAKKTIWEN